MKKRLNSSSKRKWIINGLLGFGAVALLTTGFATWVIGASNTTDNDGATVTVDTAVRNNVALTVDITESLIYVGEDVSSAKGSFITGLPATGEETQKVTDFEVTMNIKLEVGANAGTYSKINFSFAYGLEANEELYPKNVTDKNKVTLNETNAWHTSTSYEYLKINETKETNPNNDGVLSLDLPTEVSEVANAHGFVMTQDAQGNKTYTATALKLNIFDWGSFFDGKAPSAYYNELYSKGTIKNTTDNVNEVYDELAGLQVFNSKSIFVKAEAQLAEKTE